MLLGVQRCEGGIDGASGARDSTHNETAVCGLFSNQHTAIPHKVGVSQLAQCFRLDFCECGQHVKALLGDFSFSAGFDKCLALRQTNFLYAALVFNPVSQIGSGNVLLDCLAQNQRICAQAASVNVAKYGFDNAAGRVCVFLVAVAALLEESFQRCVALFGQLSAFNIGKGEAFG